MATIRASVGRRARNDPRDVRVVQPLLNGFLAEMHRTVPLVVDGKAGNKTIAAIRSFQRKVVGLRQPDERVDPGGTTLAVLSKPSALVRLPQDAPGLYRYCSSVTRHYGTPQTVRSIQSIARKFQAATGAELGVGDISLRNGGDMPPHSTHKRGFQVDLRPARKDGRKAPVTIGNGAAYSRSHTRKLVQLIRRDPNFDRLLFNDTQIAGVIEFPGHDNHLHVVFKA